jgi:hypothetical protein
MPGSLDKLHGDLNNDREFVAPASGTRLRLRLAPQSCLAGVKLRMPQSQRRRAESDLSRSLGR